MSTEVAQATEAPAVAPAEVNVDDMAALWAAGEKLAEAAEKGDTAPTEAAKVEPAKASEEADKAEPEAKADDAEAEESEEDAEPETLREREVERLKALAAKHGFKIEGDTVAVEERAAFRAERRKAKEAFRAEREAWEAEQGKREATFAERESLVKRLQDAVEAGDLDGIAAVAGLKTWVEANQHYLRQKASPEAKQIEALKREIAERKERESKEAAERQTREQAAKVERERKEYMAELSSDVEDAEDEAIRELGKVDGFKEMVLRHEQAEYNPHLNTTIPRKEAIARAMADARKSWESLNAIFGKQAPAEPAAKPGAGRPARRPDAKGTGGKSLGLDQIDTSTPEGNAAWLKAAEALFKQAGG